MAVSAELENQPPLSVTPTPDLENRQNSVPETAAHLHTAKREAESAEFRASEDTPPGLTHMEDSTSFGIQNPAE